MSLNIVIERKRKSWDFKVDPKQPDSIQNNIKNNMCDVFNLFDDDALIFSAPCQSVANLGESIKEGYFKIKTFIQPKDSKFEIHGIIETQEIDGFCVNCEELQEFTTDNKLGRYLIHSIYSNKLQCDSEYAFSSGCILLSSSNLEAFNKLLHAYDVQAGDTISGEIVEESNDSKGEKKW